MFDLKTYLRNQRNKVNEALQRYTTSACAGSRLHDAVTYTLMAQGKRLRPVLCLATCTLVGGCEQDAMPAACALEMIHTYSLIHDDLPALDDDDLRRGRPTCHKAFDEATAILAGDALLTLAFDILSLDRQDLSGKLVRRRLDVIALVSRAAGCKGMIEGQAQDLAFEGRVIDEQTLRQMHQLKTGALISAAVASGAVMAGAGEEQLASLSVYARKIGLAFQVVDDILNVLGNTEQLGKAVGTDQARRKNTYPALLGLAGAQQYARDLVDGALQALTGFDNKAEPLRALARYTIERQR